jgi:magnesium-protoporphyrin O-methyltransferase
MPAYASVLDVGAGVGALTCELLAGTSATATIVEASSAYLDAARRAVERLGIADRVRFLHGDFVELAGAVAPVDVVTMDRVVCCYPAFAPLLEAAAARAARGVALSYPRNRWFVRAVMAVQNRFREWRHSPFRTFAHPPAAIHALLAERGFRLRRARPMLVWTVEVWERAGSA